MGSSETGKLHLIVMFLVLGGLWSRAQLCVSIRGKRKHTKQQKHSWLKLECLLQKEEREGQKGAKQAAFLYHLVYLSDTEGGHWQDQWGLTTLPPYGPSQHLQSAASAGCHRPYRFGAGRPWVVHYHVQP